MVAEYRIAEVSLGPGLLGIAPMPGRGGAYQGDLTAILQWGAGLVLTMTSAEELNRAGAANLGLDLGAAGVGWHHLPIPDFGAPPPATARLWKDVAPRAHTVLTTGGRVLAHCYGGCGRSGMALLRLMVEAGEPADAALARLRKARPCAVETPSQQAWATAPALDRGTT
ncbi:MAG: protein phosphatase [Silicimonas sp.]|nr:protein phosphatase [Silicimonas sp.]NNF71067.1 protein phosphatase [Paracoccaceae bacterium]RZV98574.1 MAG: protein phosphatase [Paracoccaceae bacterium]